MGYNGYGHMMYGWGWIIWLIIIILAGVAVYYLIKQSRGGMGFPPRTGGDTAIDILKQRFARGEISKEEFDRMKNELQDSP